MKALGIILAILFLGLGGCAGLPQATPDQASPISSLTPEPLPPALTEKSIFTNGKGPVYSQEWSPDGKRLATAGYREVNLWDVSSGKRVVLQGHSDFVWGVSWSPDGQILASAGQDNVRLWNPVTATGFAILPTAWAFCLDWSPDGRTLAVGIMNGELQLWDAATREKKQSLQPPQPGPMISLGWSPDGETIACGYLTGEIVLWQSTSGVPRQTIKGYTDFRSDVNGLDWSPDGTTLATGHQDGMVRFWNPDDGTLTRTISAHQGWVRGVCWSPDGRILATSGQDKKTCLWDGGSGDKLAEATHDDLPVWSVAWSPDGKLISSGSGEYESERAGATIVWTVPSY